MAVAYNGYVGFDGRHIRLPIPDQVRAQRLTEGQLPSYMPQSYDEVIFDYRTNSYRTMSQTAEIARLEQQLTVQKKEKKEKVQSIIGYFYKRR